jgi:hypothetical protein
MRTLGTHLDTSEYCICIDGNVGSCIMRTLRTPLDSLEYCIFIGFDVDSSG